MFTRTSFFLLLFGVFYLAPAALFGKHIIGGDVTYECLGETFAGSGVNRYLITMNVYRDCDPFAGGADFDIPANFSVFRGTTSNATFVQSFQISDYEYFKIEADTPDCVLKVPFVCVEQAKYTFLVELPIDASDSYMIVYQRCCRNNSILNLIDPESLGATYQVEIKPSAQQRCNNSPVFNEFPPIIICKDSPLRFDHSATDQDGDLLVYKFCAPELGGGPILTNPGYTECEGALPTPPCGPPFLPVPYASPYTPGNPIGGNPQVTINPVTGLITGVPNIVGRFVVGVCVEEYRNGILLSVIKRDFQFNVTDCDPQVLVKIAGGDTLILTPQGYYLNTCGPKELYIENQSLDRNFIKDDFEWRFDINGTPYFNNSDWSPTIDFPSPGRYFGKLYLKPGSECADTADIIIDVFPDVVADFEYAYDTCVAGPVTFNNLSFGAGLIETYKWQYGVPGGTSVERDPVFEYQNPGVFPVRLTVRDTNGCVDSRLKPITWYPAPATVIIKPSSFVGCVPGIITFTNLSKPIDETYGITWDFGDGGRDTGVISPTHIYNEPGLYTVSLGITSPLGCYISDTFPNLIRVVPGPIADFSYAPTELTTLNSTVNFTDLSEGAVKWFWQFGANPTTNVRNPTYTFPDTGLVRVLLVVTHPEGCKDSISKILDIKPVIYWYMPNAFTPNGDGTNDGFFGKGFLEGVLDFNMTIWNRWGELVFETDNKDDQWNGRAQNTGGNSPTGVYTYRVTFTGPRGDDYEYKGFATLIR